MEVESAHSMSIAPNDIRDNEHRGEDKCHHWQWQEPNTAWYGVGIYHVTLTVTDRRPVLGELVIPDNDPKQARVEWSDLGRQVLGHLVWLDTIVMMT